MKLKLIGFFKELNYGLDDIESINNYITNISAENKDEIVSYLKHGNLMVCSPGVTKDVINEVNGVIGGRGIVTDGVWAWPKELSYYVEEYNIKLPKEFIDYINENRWKIPLISEESLANLEI